MRYKGLRIYYSIGMSNLNIMSGIIGWSFVIVRKMVTIISCSEDLYSLNASFGMNQPTESFSGLAM